MKALSQTSIANYLDAITAPCNTRTRSQVQNHKWYQIVPIDRLTPLLGAIKVTRRQNQQRKAGGGSGRRFSHYPIRYWHQTYYILRRLRTFYEVFYITGHDIASIGSIAKMICDGHSLADCYDKIPTLFNSTDW